MSKKTIIIVIAILILIIGVFAYFQYFRKSSQNISFNLVVIKKGNISNTVTATGTIEATKTVQVGTQISGVIIKLFCDFNTVVKKGQLLAKIDETPLKEALNQSMASVEAAKASLALQELNYNRAQTLFEKKFLSQADYDQVNYNYKNALAMLKNAEAAHAKNKTNLKYASIYSPINGVVLNRAVDEGQTVAASFNTPTLFTIAEDLTKMQVEAKVDEADIGQVKDRQRVEFTVDAFPKIKFDGIVIEIRNQPLITNNVVTYTVIINAENPDKKLMPGMTANTTIIVEEANDVQVIPIKAIHFKPDSILLSNFLKNVKLNESFSQKEGKSKKTKNDSINHVWIKNENDIKPLKIITGMNDGINVEVKSGLNSTDSVIVSIEQSKDGEAKEPSSKSPFMPSRTPPKKR